MAGKVKQQALPQELAIADIAEGTNIREVDRKSVAFGELVKDIVLRGILEPLLVRPISGVMKSHELISGYRRMAAAREAKLTVVPVVVLSATDAERAEIQLVENLIRENLTPMEEARGVHAYSEGTHAKPKEIALRLSKSETWVRDRLKLLNLIPRGQQLLADGKVTAQIAAIVAGYPAAVQEAVFPGPDDDEWNIEDALHELNNPTAARRLCDNLKGQLDRQQAFAQKVSGSKFPKCPKCGKDAQRESGGGTTAVCEEGHIWSLATGKLANDYANDDHPRRSGPARIKIDRKETRTLRGVRTPQEIASEYLARVKVDFIKFEAIGKSLSVTFELSGENVPDSLTTKENATFCLGPLDYSTGELTQVVVDGYDGPARRKTKAVVRNFLAEYDDGKPAKKESDMKEAIDKLLGGERADVIKRLGKVKDRELLERAREAEAEGEARASIMIEMDQLIGLWQSY